MIVVKIIVFVLLVLLVCALIWACWRVKDEDWG